MQVGTSSRMLKGLTLISVFMVICVDARETDTGTADSRITSKYCKSRSEIKILMLS